MNKLYYFFITAMLVSGFASAQRQLTLEECIDIALKNNLDVKMAENDVLIAQSNETQSKHNFLPSLNAEIGYDLVHGTSFDQTNAKISSTRKSSSPSIYTEVTLFNGLRNHNTLKRNQILKEAALKNIQSSKDRVELVVLDLYLQVLIDQEEIKIINERLEALEEQLQRANKRVDAGVANMQQVYNLNSQIANERLSLVNAENKLKSDKLYLLQALQVDMNQEFDAAPLEIDDEQIQAVSKSYTEVLQSALNHSPAMDHAELLVEASEKDVKIAKADGAPSLTLTGAVASMYSSNGAFDPERNEIVNMPYFDQLDLNRNEYVSVNLRIPIFNRNRVKNSVQVSEINAANAELTYQQTRMELMNRVQQAYHDLLSAQTAHQAARENLAALTQAYIFAETSYNSGNADFYSYLESLKNKNRAEFNLKISQYSYVFRKKILDVYMGNGFEN